MSVLYRSLGKSRKLIPSLVICDANRTFCFLQLNPKVKQDRIGRISRRSPFLFMKYSSESIIRCWNCDKEYNYNISMLFCNYCNALRKPNNGDNLFDIIGIEQTFDLDESKLMTKYKNLQKQLHPDKYGTRGAEERRISEEYSSLVNKAYSTLLKPLTRGIYLLQLHGLEIPEKTEMESVFLMEVMEKNEEVEQAEMAQEILKLNLENKITMKCLCEDFSEALRVGNMDKAISILIRLKYFDSIDDKIKSIIRRKGIIE